MDTLTDPNLTMQWDKLSCMRGAYFAHVVFCYLTFLAGVAAMASRCIPPIKALHPIFGRAYIVNMLWATATSLIIHNSGLPPSTLISFVWVLGGLCVAWFAIKFHEAAMDKAALARVQALLATPGGVPDGFDLAAELAAAKAAIAASKSARQRLFSIKAFHGAVMFVSWINIAGRIFASNQTGDFTCHTATVFKPIAIKGYGNFTGQPLTLMPSHDPDFARLPWARTGLVGWSLAMLFGPLLGALLVGAVWSWAAVSLRDRRASRTTPQRGGSSELVEAGVLPVGKAAAPGMTR